ncbi:hypothetical protein [Rhodopirellula sp. SWK7]|uniref:hypothetical protein n=1 Tax=Rhodopirellula sp. SWK7 TaxID=595460 RepID=UPI0011818B69|nr:hypothetical protein [Rhodopirellula sp. SWK7]
MNKRDQRIGNSPKLERTLRLEPLESRALMAADFFGAAEFGPSQSGDRLLVERGHADRFAEVAKQELRMRASDGLQREAATTLEHASIDRHNVLVFRPLPEARHDISSPAVGTPAWDQFTSIRVKEFDGIDRPDTIKWISLDRNTPDRLSVDRIVREVNPLTDHVLVFSKVELISVRPIQAPDIVIAIANVPQRESDGRAPVGRGDNRPEGVITESNSNENADVDAVADDDLLDRVISTIAKDRTRNQSTVSAVTTTSTAGQSFAMNLSSHVQDAVSTSLLVSPLSNQGGMIEIDSLESSDTPSDLPDESDAEPWQIERSTLEEIAETAHDELESEPSEPSTDLAVDESGNGGLIAIAHADLPASVILPNYQPIEIQLDPSMGHFRSFQLAAVPEHDRESSDPADLLTRLQNGFDQENVTESTVYPPNISSVAYAGMIFVGGIVLTVELRGRKTDLIDEPEETGLS